jgi:hypothetical protein
LDRTEKIQKVAQTTGTIEVFDPHSGISGPTLHNCVAFFFTDSSEVSLIALWK